MKNNNFKTNRGIGLIELVASIVIILVCIFAVHEVLIRSLVFYRQNKLIVMAYNAASVKMEELLADSNPPTAQINSNKDKYLTRSQTTGYSKKVTYIFPQPVNAAVALPPNLRDWPLNLVPNMPKPSPSPIKTLPPIINFPINFAAPSPPAPSPTKPPTPPPAAPAAATPPVELPKITGNFVYLSKNYSYVLTCTKGYESNPRIYKFDIDVTGPIESKYRVTVKLVTLKSYKT